MTDLSRRGLLGGVGALAFAHTAGARAQNYCSETALTRPAERSRSLPLGSISKRVQWGIAIEQPGLYDPELRAALRSQPARFLAIASGLKFGSLHPLSMAYHRSNGESTWVECDDTVALAKGLRRRIRGHRIA